MQSKSDDFRNGKRIREEIQPKKTNDYYFLYLRQKRMLVNRVLEVIKENEGMAIDKLIIKLTVNDPFLSKLRAKEYVKDLAIDEQIRITKDNKVFINDDAD